MAVTLKNVKYDISAAVQLILMKFGTMIHIIPINLMGDQQF